MKYLVKVQQNKDGLTIYKPYIKRWFGLYTEIDSCVFHACQYAVRRAEGEVK
jgi:hypothetical protein